MPSALATISQKIRSFGINAFRLCRDGIHRQNSKPKLLPASKKSKKREAFKRLCEGISSSDLQLSYFNEKTNYLDADNLICMDVINFVESGSLDQALILLDLSKKAGFRSDRLDVNRARVLMSFERYAEVFKIWIRLAKSEDDMLKKRAATQLRKLLNLFLKRSYAMLKLHEWEIKYLPTKAPDGVIMELEILLIQETTAIREAKRYQLALMLLEKALSFGLHSPETDHNRAQILAELNRIEEATILWNKILAGDITAEMRNTISELLKPYDVRVDVQKVSQLIKNMDQSDLSYSSAVEILVDHILKYPHCKYFKEELEILAVKHGETKSVQDENFDQNESHRKSIAGFDAFLSVLEKRYESS